MNRTFFHFCFCIFFLLINVAFGQTCPVISTYFGKGQFDEFKGICRDTKGYYYAIGNTFNNDLPVTAGAFQSAYKADYEAFIVKFDSCGSLIWCTYLGTQGFDHAEKVVYSSDSSIVITGYTNGTDLATTPGCFQSSTNGNNDCFIAKFGLDGQPKWITYFGGAQSDFSYAVTLDKKNNIIIGGTSLSPTIHTTPSSFQQNLAGAVDAFIARFNSNGQFKFSTFYGGTSSEDIHDVAADADGNIIGVGGSFSNNLSTTAGCLQASSNGGMEIYVIKLDSVGNRIFSTYIGGTGLDDAYGVAADQAKNIYLSGHTASTDFYTTSVTHQTVVAGSTDGYCMKLTSGGALVWSTIFGGTQIENNVHCKLDDANDLFALYNTQSSDFPFLGTNNYTLHNGAADLALVKVSNSGQLIWSTLKGGTGNETSSELILQKNKVLVCGSSASPDFPVLTNNYQLVNNGQEDGFLSTINVSVTINVVHTFLQKNTSAAQCESFFQLTSGGKVKVCESIVSIAVYDILGRTIIEQRIQRDDILNFEKLHPNEMYILVGYDMSGSFVFSEKIIRQGNSAY